MPKKKRDLGDVPVEREFYETFAAAIREKDYAMSTKKFMSTVLLFAVFLGFLWWGVSVLFDPHKNGEKTPYSILFLGCSLFALLSPLLLPPETHALSHTFLGCDTSIIPPPKSCT